jgi:hypothetical protein
MIMTMIFSLKAWLCYLAEDANGMVNLFGSLDSLSEQTGFVVAPENLISEPRTIYNARPQGDLTQEQILSISLKVKFIDYSKKNILVYKQRRLILYQCEENFKDAIRFKKTNGRSVIWLQFRVISFGQLSEQALRYDLFCLKPYLSRQRHLRYPFGLWPFEEERGRIIGEKR